MRKLKLIISFLFVFIIWQGISTFNIFTDYFFPSPKSVFETGSKLLLEGTLLKYTLVSLFNSFIGFAIGSLSGIILGMICGVSNNLREYVSPLIDAIYPIPGIVWLPFSLLWFGFTLKALIFTVALSTFFSVFYNTLTGVKNINVTYIRAAKSLGLKGYKYIKEIIFLGSFPFTLVGLKLGFGISWRVIIAAEMLTFNAKGLGWFLWTSSEFGKYDNIFVGIIIIAIIGLVIEKLIFKKIEELTVKKWGLQV